MTRTEGTTIRRPLLEVAWVIWLMRAGLVAVVLYAGVAMAFYSWYADFPGPNQESARVVAGIWSVVALAGFGALVASLFRRRPPSSTPPVG
jgi:hypothetical protein